MTEQKWIVTAETSGDVAAALKKAGFSIDQTLDAIGVYVGRSTAAVADKLRTIDGVTDVSPDTDIDIGPPDGDRTW